MKYLDANLFVRYLVRDHPEMSPAAFQLFEKLSRSLEEVAVLEATVAEVVYVLSSRALYALPRADIRERLRFLLSHRSVHITDKSRCLRALDLYATHTALSFGDALIAAAVQAEPPHELYSYDRGFDRVEGVVRIEP